MRKKADAASRLFKAVCIVFSLLLLMLTLMSHVRLMAVENCCVLLEEEIFLAEYDAELLRVKLENRISLEQLEQIAVNQLGMQRVSAEQLYFNMIPG